MLLSGTKETKLILDADKAIIFEYLQNISET